MRWYTLARWRKRKKGRKPESAASPHPSLKAVSAVLWCASKYGGPQLLDVSRQIFVALVAAAAAVVVVRRVSRRAVLEGRHVMLTCADSKER
jgi:hypothetical protein